MKSVLVLGIALLVFLRTPENLYSQIEERMQSHTVFLSSDSLMGRGSGSKGLGVAAAYIAGKFKEIGLEPYEKDGYYQKFRIPHQEVPEQNVVGYLPGNSPSQRSVIFTAHYDGLGVGKKTATGDSIFNGARDNAAGVAALIELARIYSNGEPPPFNMVFIATAAEESGLHGSRYYLNHPVFPREEIIICLNIDGFNVSGPRSDFYIFPRQGINFLERMCEILANKGWVYASPDWIDSMNTMFDTATFLERGVPAITLWQGDLLPDGTRAAPIPFGQIHSAEDEVTALWDWTGTMGHLQMYRELGDYFLRFPDSLEVTKPELFKINKDGE
ncbi:M28 family peptidase [Robertkochia flava]|uniref:M28 family peptidase n=1 Tax=Robertkochia flava TaxID=3447986 RepID=UPI001CCAB214|nr:M28 family peptidase [Robertkochia marina]